MKKALSAPLATIIAIGSGLVILLGYFFSVPLLMDLRSLFLGWAVILAGVAALVGVLNLVIVHWMKFANPEKRNMLSLVLLLSFAITLGLGIWLTPADPNFQKIVTYIQMPLETSLLAILVVVLSVAALQLAQRRRDFMSVLFLCSALLFLILESGVISLFGELPLVKSFLGFVQQLPLAGARGILLGVALGSLTTGLRILLGADRPYSG